MTRREKIRYLILRTAGNFLILFTIFGVVATFGPALYFEFKYRVEQSLGVEYVSATDGINEASFNDIISAGEGEDGSGGFFDVVVSGNHEQVLVPKSSDFSLVIPKIGANQTVIPNVDPTVRDEYLEALTKGIAHAKGSNFPGQGGTTYLFAHSADVFWNVGRYNADFYLLKDLEEQDEITVIFDEQRYNYRVAEQRVVDPSEVGFLTSDRGEGEELILQTCWPPGTTWKRLLVFAEPVGN